MYIMFRYVWCVTLTIMFINVRDYIKLYNSLYKLKNLNNSNILYLYI